MTTDARTAQPTLPLSLVGSGESAEVIEIRLNVAEKQRLQELGILPGTPLRVIKNDPETGLIVAVRQDGRLALNRNTAHKLIVRMEQ